MQQLDDSNFMLYAAAHYDNPQCYDTDEFYDDLKRFKYLKRLFNEREEILRGNKYAPASATNFFFALFPLKKNV